MSQLEIKRLEMQILMASAAKAELEFKKQERLEDIKRIEDHIKKQEELIEEHTASLKKMKGKE